MFGFLFHVTRFINDATGLEKTLRLLQAICQICAAYAFDTKAAGPYLLARKQFALGRRYLRFLKFVTAFEGAYYALTTLDAIHAVLECGRWSCLGLYLLLESCTILDAMGVYPVAWAPFLFLEAMKFWFYSLCLGLVINALDLYDILTSSARAAAVEKRGRSMSRRAGKSDKSRRLEMEKAERERWERETKNRRDKAIKAFTMNACDLVIPGSVTGWLAISTANVGWCSVVGTSLSMIDIWARINGV